MLDTMTRPLERTIALACFLSVTLLPNQGIASPSAAPPERTRDLQARVKLNPLDTLAHNELGVALAGSGDLEGAARHLWLAVIADEALMDAWANLCLVTRKERRHEVAVAAFGKALTLNPVQPEIWYSAGASLRALKNDSAALFALEAFMKHAPKEHPKRPKVIRVIEKWAKRGVTAQAPKWPAPNPPKALLREVTEARQEVQRREKEAQEAARRDAPKEAPTSSALDLGSKTPGAESALPRHGGDQAFHGQHYVEAMKNYESEARIRPSDSVLLYKLGATRAILGDHAGALRAWRKVVEQSPARLIVNRQIAFATRRLADWGMVETSRTIEQGKAIAAARSALLAEDPADVLLITAGSEDPEALFLRGEAALRLGRLESALSAFDKGLTIAPDDRGLLGGRIEVLIHQGHEDAAEAAQEWLDDMESTPAAFLAERALVVARRIRYGRSAASPDDEFDDEFEDDID